MSYNINIYVYPKGSKYCNHDANNREIDNPFKMIISSFSFHLNFFCLLFWSFNSRLRRSSLKTGVMSMNMRMRLSNCINQSDV